MEHTIGVNVLHLIETFYEIISVQLNVEVEH